MNKTLGISHSEFATLSTTNDTPGTITMPDVWRQNISNNWCSDCREGDLTQDRVLSEVEAMLGELPEYLTHLQVEHLAQRLMELRVVCRFFQMSVEDAARRVHGNVAQRYPLAVGVAMAFDVMAHWNGCPEELCEA